LFEGALEAFVEELECEEGIRRKGFVVRIAGIKK
jgi:hypothetical protein